MITARLAFDAGPGAGLGHRRRTEAIATELKRRCVECVLVPADQPAAADIVLVDSYQQRADRDGHFRGRVLAAIDDLDRDLAVDVLVDPNPPASRLRRTNAKFELLGPRYAPLLPLEGGTVKPIADTAQNFLVTTGAADVAGIGQAVAAALVRRFTDRIIRVVLGPWGDQTVPAGAVGIRAPDGLEAELGRSDVVVTAGGVTLLEALRLGRPTVAFVTASNQRRAVVGAVAAGAALEATSPEEAAGLASSLASDAPRRRHLSSAAKSYVDGRGAERVASKLVELYSEALSG